MEEIVTASPAELNELYFDLAHCDDYDYDPCDSPDCDSECDQCLYDGIGSSEREDLYKDIQNRVITEIHIRAGAHRKQ